jgi:pimeloyl-ACP methyl ester carboxylesterase
LRGALPGSQVSYAVDGAGLPVLLLHAFPLGLAMWDGQVRALESHCEFIRMDDRGFGGSPLGADAFTMDQVADDAAALLDHLGHDRAVVGGCSMGGYASLAFARRHPQRLRGLVLIDTRAGADTPEGREKRRSLAEAVRARGHAPVLEAFLPGLVGRTSHAERPEVVSWVEKTTRGNPPEGLARGLLGMGAREDSFPTLGEIRVPTLVVCGAEDVLTPPAESQKLHEGIQGSRLALIERAGHLANLENPVPFNRVLEAFLRDLAGGS